MTPPAYNPEGLHANDVVKFKGVRVLAHLTHLVQ